MIIRQPNISDSASLVILLDQLGYPARSDAFVQEKIEFHRQGNYHLLVGDAGGEIIGFISMHWFDMFHSSGYMGRITAVCVRGDFRSKGAGKQLIHAAEQFLFSSGCSYVEVTCNLRRTMTHEFYRKNGYEEDSKRFIKKTSGRTSSPPVA